MTRSVRPRSRSETENRHYLLLLEMICCKLFNQRGADTLWTELVHTDEFDVADIMTVH